MLPSIWFVKKSLLVGGTELLIERVCKEMKTRGYKVGVLYQERMEDINCRYSHAGIKQVLVPDWEGNTSFSILKNSKKVKYIVTFSIEDFCAIYNICNNNIKTLLYTVYYDQLLIGGKTKSKLGLYIVKRNVAALLDEMLKSKNIVCMDEHTIEDTYDYYSDYISIDKSLIKIIRIPVDIVPADINIIKKRAKEKTCNILTISRADFPWKGYIIGLINYILKYGDKMDLKLHIVTYGAEEKKILDTINNMPDDVKKRITIQGKTDYNDLENLYVNTTLYVGQGTTVLDAAQRGIISIPVEPDTYDVKSDAFMHEDYTRVTVPKNRVDKFNRMIEIIVNMTEDEYVEKAVLGRKQIVDNYGTKSVCDEIFNVFNQLPFNSKKSKNVQMFLNLKRIKRGLNSIFLSKRK